MPRQRLGILTDAVIPIESTVDCARMAEDRGFYAVWVSDSSPREAFVPLTACGIATERIRLGTAIVVAPARNPLTVAGAVMNLDEISGNRTILGLGVGSTWTKEAGIRINHPVGFMQEYVDVMRRLFRGGEFPFHGKSLSVESIDWWQRLGYTPPNQQVPIYAAAVGPKMLEMAGEMADGVILGSVNNLDYLKIARRHLEVGAKRAGRSMSQFDFGALLLTFIGKDSRAMKKIARARLASYASLPSYRSTLKLMGYRRERMGIEDAMSRGDLAGAINHVTDRMVDDIAMAGTAEECRGKLEEYKKAGLTHPVIYPIQTEGRKPKEVYSSALGLGD